MMRITNAMMTSNTKNNININKLNEDRLNTQISTGQVISRPSEDPVVAIRALRLNTNLSQLTQYYKKNIPDAQAWMNVTETALKQTNDIFTNIKENLTAGASDNHTATDRQKILENLKGLRAELYSSGNADYAERTVFTGYRTGESLTFLETDTDLKSDYMIHEELKADSLEKIKYVNTFDPEKKTGSGDPAYMEKDVKTSEINRIRLAYGDLMQPSTSYSSVTINFEPNAASTTDPKYHAPITANVVSIAGMSQQDIDDIYLMNSSTDPILIAETGELILNTTDANNYTGYFKDYSDVPAAKATIEYHKNEWKSGDLRPEHYFACVQTVGSDTTYFNYDLKLDSSDKPLIPTQPDPSKPNFKNQDIEVEISFNQKITINTHANEVYTHDIGRDIDELLAVTQSVVDADEMVTKYKNALNEATTDAEKKKAQLQLDAAEKEYAMKKDKMQKMFSAALDQFDAYADRNNVAIANIGSMQSRLTITKERVADQLQSFKELADKNINAELTETSIDFTSAKLALEAAQLAAGKIAQQTLLNYL